MKQQHTPPRPVVSARRLRAPGPGVALFLLLLGWYVLTMSGHTYSSDEETMLAVGEQIVSAGSFAIPRDELMNVSGGVDGRTYSRYGPAQSVTVVPFILAGHALAGVAPPRYAGFVVRLSVLLLPALVTAATGLLLYAWARAIGYGIRVALTVGLLYGLTSLAWPYSRTFFAEPLATLFLVLCAYAMRRATPRWWTIAGAAAACALATKFQTALALPLIALYAILVPLTDHREPEQRTTQRVPDKEQRDDRPRNTQQFSQFSILNSQFSISGSRALFGPIAFGLLGAALPLGALLLYNTLLFGGPLKVGYGGVSPAQWMTEPWQEGLYGLTLSTGKGLLIVSPTVALGLIGLGLRLRQQWREALLALALLLAHMAFYSRLPYWHGDGSWGPRYLVFVVPFLYLPVAGLLAALAPGATRGRWWSRGARVLAGGLVAASFAVQLMPVLVNFDTYIQLSSEHDRYFVPAASPIAAHARIWGQRAAEWWSRVAPPARSAVLRDGFSYSEGDRSKGEVLPRWSYADGRVQLYPDAAGPIEGTLVVGDHRPWPLPRANFTLLLDGQPFDGVQRTDLTGQQIMWELRFQLTPEQARRGATLSLHSDTWNPTLATTDNPRNEDLGLYIQSLELRQGQQPLALREALPIPQPGKTRRALWLWYQDTPLHHLFDVWLWYVLVAGLPAPSVALLLALIGLPALLAAGAGLHGVIAAFERGRSGTAEAAEEPRTKNQEPRTKNQEPRTTTL